ncbi:uncharacterized protein LOC102804394, partial [Saccoglossus kowalevskii]|uniref:Uncharacterized protein LOC102804394 n=1 Tax=Saccoglossus kowalevskii TaxID=10224 RepID=A0ABM0MUI2_SACKO
DVRLSGGQTPFQGRVEIRRDNGEWGMVCAMNAQKWDSMEARVVCKQLGFVDAMWTWSNSKYGVSNLPVSECGISCDVSATSLNNCTISSTGSCNNCQDKHAGVTCYFPGFLGRYKEGNPNRIFQTSSNMYTIGNSITTIQGCIQTCRDNSKPIAVLASADECYCGDDDTDYQQYGEAVPGEMINEYVFYGTLQCSGDNGTEPYIQGCGGDYQLDVYDTTIGACGGQYTGDSGYIYSPNFPGKYPDNQNCIWTITVEDNHIIQLSILMAKISTGDYLDIRDGDDVTAPQITWNSMTVYSSGNILWLQFYSNSDMNTDLGFALTYQALPQCSKPHPVYSNVIMTPSPLSDYFNPGDSITFRCTTGYILNGVSVITCQDDGQWNSSVPTCTDDGQWNSSVSTCTSEMINIALQLDEQLVIQNCILNGVSVITCQDDGQWNSSVPTCTVITSVSTPSSITILKMTDTTHKSELNGESKSTDDTSKYSSTPSGDNSFVHDTTFKPSVSSSESNEDMCEKQFNQTGTSLSVYVGVSFAVIIIVIIPIVVLMSIFLCRRVRLKSADEREMTNLGETSNRTYQDLITDVHPNDKDNLDKNEYQSLNIHDEQNKTEMEYVNTPKPGAYEELAIRSEVIEQKKDVGNVQWAIT